jgi:RNA polymerase sigma factor (sigma-70 family)
VVTSSSQNGTREPSFDDVFCGLLHRLYRRAAMLAGSRQTAEDSVHEVYLKLAARPQKFLAHPEPYAYAFSALLSVLRDGWRRERGQVLLADVEFGGAEHSGGGRSLSGGQWDGGVEQRASEIEVLRLLRQLSVRQAGVVILVDLDGYTIDQAAEILNVHRGTVARTRKRALDKLRGTLLDRRPESAGRSETSGEERHAC